MRKLLVCMLCFCLAVPGIFAADPVTLGGYSDAAARAERDWEVKFRAIPDPANLRSYMRRLSAHPHHVGSPYDAENADWLLSRLKEWGFDAHIETFDVLFPTPKERSLELVEPTHFTAKLAEPTVAADPTSAQHAEQLPTYNAYSIDGDVTAPLVYVNFGVPDDYEMLERLGISVKGAIVIARYGGSWRGIKPKVAAEHGAVGCLIYSDPHEDGYFAGEVFPEGGLRNHDGVQRGSVMDMPVYPGDPLTPGVGATKDAKRLPIAQAATLTKIPVLPISYADAQPLLAAIAGAGGAGRLARRFAHHLSAGPGPAKVHLKLAFNWDLKPLYDVIGRIPGASEPDEWVIRGNHHDAWVNGADDPISGAVAVLEEARAFGELLRQGWKPKRTIVYCFWDGEEPGLLGSTEWAEAHDAELRHTGAVYINSDSNGRGFLEMSGSHTLERFVNGVAREIPDPESNVSIWQRQQFHRLANPAPGATPEDRNELRTRPDLRIGALGSGSDYTAFLDHLGIASLDLGFGGEDRGRHLPFHLRRFLLVHPLLRYDFRLWARAGPDRGHGRAAAGRRPVAALRFRRFHGHHPPLCGGGAKAGQGQARPDRGAEPADRRRCLRRHRRSPPAHGPASQGRSAAVAQFRTAGQRPGRARPRRTALPPESRPRRRERRRGAGRTPGCAKSTPRWWPWSDR